MPDGRGKLPVGQCIRYREDKVSYPANLNGSLSFEHGLDRVRVERLTAFVEVSGLRQQGRDLAERPAPASLRTGPAMVRRAKISWPQARRPVEPLVSMIVGGLEHDPFLVQIRKQFE